ncbi:MAG: DUF4956 domain-containing protein [Defluviitaleaceae bacterium]|nr:DUF4956 domain-containing protein [Defluviitaleaceae bacterium]
MFDSISGNIVYNFPPTAGLIITTLVSLLMGLIVSMIYRYRTNYSQSLSMTLVVLPALVQIIIMLASGNIGVGIAVAGAFQLVRFRSIPGTAREIAHLFFAMSLGFVTGLGYIFFAFIFLIIIGVCSIILTVMKFGDEEEELRTLRIRIPENLDYDGLFDEVFEKHTKGAELETVRTSQMGSIFELKYLIRLKSAEIPKAFIDDLRIRNGNLSIRISRGNRNREFLSKL